MSDEELLLMYRQYKTKRRMIILIIIFFIILSLLIVYKFPKIDNKRTIKDNKEAVKEVIDNIPPDLILTVDSIEILQGEEIDYISYIKSAVDNIDGDLKDKVKYNEIDSSEVGEYLIVYSVSDSSNNSIQKELIVIIKQENITEEKEQLGTDTPVVDQNNTPNKSNNSSTNNSTSNNESKPKSEEKIVKYFLFSDGYTMSNVTEACSSELKKYNRAGMCIPLQDENGIYLGMKLEID